VALVESIDPKITATDEQLAGLCAQEHETRSQYTVSSLRLRPCAAPKPCQGAGPNPKATPWIELRRSLVNPTSLPPSAARAR
jgi:hypothetical protein